MKSVRKSFFPGLWLLTFLVFLGCRETQTQAEQGRYKVIAIKDGDTIELLKDGQPLRVRLQGVDTPEKKQDFGSKAQDFTAELVFGKYVALQVHDIDRYGRTVGEIILQDGRNLGKELVKAGYAWHYTAYSKDQELARLELEARTEKRGLWAGPSPVAPWDYRRPKTGAGNQAPGKVPNAIPKTAATSKASISQKSGKVFICQSKGSKTYHLNRDCYLLKNCKTTVATITLAQARSEKRTPCKVCAQ